MTENHMKKPSREKEEMFQIHKLKEQEGNYR